MFKEYKPNEKINTKNLHNLSYKVEKKISSNHTLIIRDEELRPFIKIETALEWIYFISEANFVALQKSYIF